MEIIKNYPLTALRCLCSIYVWFEMCVEHAAKRGVSANSNPPSHLGMVSGMHVDDATWAEIRRLHETTNESHERLAYRFEVGETTIRRRSFKEAWGPRPPRPNVTPRPLVVAVAPAVLDPAEIIRPKRAERKAPDTPEARIARFFHLIDIQLDNLETLMTTGETLSAEDELRKANYFKTIVGNLEKVTEASR